MWDYEPYHIDTRPLEAPVEEAQKKNIAPSAKLQHCLRITQRSNDRLRRIYPPDQISVLVHYSACSILHSSFPILHVLLHDNTVLSFLGLASLLTFLDLLDHTLEGGVDILIEPSAGFCPSTLQLFGQFATILCLDLPLLGAKIGLVANNNQWDGVGSLVVGFSNSSKRSLQVYHKPCD